MVRQRVAPLPFYNCGFSCGSPRYLESLYTEPGKNRQYLQSLKDFHPAQRWIAQIPGYQRG